MNTNNPSAAFGRNQKASPMLISHLTTRNSNYGMPPPGTCVKFLFEFFYLIIYCCRFAFTALTKKTQIKPHYFKTRCARIFLSYYDTEPFRQRLLIRIAGGLTGCLWRMPGRSRGQFPQCWGIEE